MQSIDVALGMLSQFGFDKIEDYFGIGVLARARAEVAIPLPKRRDVQLLEDILKEHHNDENIVITKIEDLPTTRKKVKRIYYQRAGRFHGQVWLINANPDTITKELTVYYVAYKNGFPTAIPIGFDPNQQDEYRHAVALLGGVLEHAGDPYSSFVETLELTPCIISQTGRTIAAHIADMHKVLTENKFLLERYGIKLEEDTPKKGLNERLFASVNVESNYRTALIEACTSLHKLQSGSLVVLEGDMHLGQVVTTINNQGEVDNLHYGIIDFGSVCLGYRLFDLVAFDVHLQRRGREICGDAWKEDNGLVSAYSEAVKLDYDKDALSDPMNVLIQQALWHLYEIEDPVRKGKGNIKDIREKEEYHTYRLIKTLDRFKGLGDGITEADGLKTALRDMIVHTPEINHLSKYIV